MAGIGRILVWWDRDIDQAGRPIRRDVRLAGHEIWEQACQKTWALLDDHGPAAELMENSVAQVSRYLDRIGAPESSEKRGLLMLAFCRALRRHRAKSTRLKLVGACVELSNYTVDDAWIRQIDAHLDLQNIVRQLTERNGAVLMLRAAEYEWKEIAQLFGTSVAALRNSFWREVEKIRWGFSQRSSTSDGAQ
jgi:DNA-directed RNA polymerase specialized sigma24 family protein